ncbi:hypothetical protein AB0C52_01470 [Streptomyces sp. NPDC048717]|uniref:hypothetical protein n=1 Tax=Streptomyces sp. NPDC048717 TaxID=3154928 RepID=UPI003420D087
MSFEVFVTRLADGAAAPLDRAVVCEVLDPFTVARDGESLVVRTPDGGEADVRVRADCVTFHRFGGAGVMDLLSVLLDRLGAVLIVPGGPFLVHREGDAAQVTSDMRESSGWPVVVAPGGAALERGMRGAP